MIGRETIRVVQPGKKRIKIFADFWNVIINARSHTGLDISVSWDGLAEHIVSETHIGFDDTAGSLAGMYIFGSYNKSNNKEYRFVNDTLDRYGSLSGLFFDYKERVGKETAHKCPSCGQSVHRSSELGVDVLLTVEMIKHGAMREHEYLALVSSDRDYIPLLGFLKDQGQRVLHIAPGEAHRDMRAATWKQVTLKDRFTYLCKINHENRIIYTAPGYEERVNAAIDALSAEGLNYSIIDLTDKEQISDRDLVFLTSNLRFNFNSKNGNENNWYGMNHFGASPYKFRNALLVGDAYERLPVVVNNGVVEVVGDPRWGWMIHAGDAADFWKKYQISS